MAIDNPLGPTRELWFGAGSGVGYGRAQAEALADYVQLIADLEPLISDGSLILVEHSHGIDPQSDALPPELAAERAVIAELNELSRPSAAQAHLGEVSYKQWERHDATVDMGRTLGIAGRTGAYHCYAPPGVFQEAFAEAQRLCWQIVSQELGWPLRSPEASGHEDEAARLSVLLSMELPGLDKLALSDIVAVRTGSEFAFIRRVLEQALDDAVNHGLDTDPTVLRRRIWEALAEPRERVEREMRESRTLREAAKAARRPFGLSVASPGTPVGAAHDLLDGASAVSALSKVSVDGIVSGALAACWSGYAAWRDTKRRDRILGVPRDPTKSATYRHLCVFEAAEPVLQE